MAGAVDRLGAQSWAGTGPPGARQSVEGGHATSDLQLALQGIVSSAGCAAIAVSGTDLLLVHARVDPQTKTVLAHVLLLGAVPGESASGQENVGVIRPLEATIVCHPQNGKRST